MPGPRHEPQKLFWNFWFCKIRCWNNRFVLCQAHLGNYPHKGGIFQRGCCPSSRVNCKMTPFCLVLQAKSNRDALQSSQARAETTSSCSGPGQWVYGKTRNWFTVLKPQEDDRAGTQRCMASRVPLQGLLVLDSWSFISGAQPASETHGSSSSCFICTTST